ncbi:hypothetical protein [Cytobacillus sp. IB215665]|uniref:hypothetical protein n=1 Tax=Cytobacillus sp. IB215665 TaxID=3097357 RepID=UPI002A108488|nr:hypothetical protein [Cytobacillus sp. IB215665]MDX8367180.1 hypothetical protein [Cytobacillus sp. IB215665]
MDFGTIGLIVSIALIGFLYYKASNKEKKSDIRAETVQELLNYEDMSKDGLVKLHNGTYSIVIEVEPVNVKMMSISERQGVWMNFRAAMNTLPCHATLLVQSQYLDMNDYVNDYLGTSKNFNLTPELLQSAEGVSEHLKGFVERKTREYSSYIILRFNPSTYGTESGVTTGNVTVDNFLENIRGTNMKMTDEEAKELAENMLDEVGDLIYQSFQAIGIGVTRLDSVGVHNMIYQTLNRDLSIHQRLHDVNGMGSFSEFKSSLTPELMLDIEEEERRNKVS